MKYEKKTITSFVKYHRRENGQYLLSAFIISEKGKKKHHVRRFNHGIRKKKKSLNSENIIVGKMNNINIILQSLQKEENRNKV